MYTIEGLEISEDEYQEACDMGLEDYIEYE